MRRRYLVAYDIADDKRRARTYQTLLDNGDHVQYSVFLCELSARELAELKGRLGQVVHHREDQVLFLDLGKADHELGSRLRCLGKAYEPPSRVQVV